MLNSCRWNILIYNHSLSNNRQCAYNSWNHMLIFKCVLIMTSLQIHRLFSYKKWRKKIKFFFFTKQLLTFNLNVNVLNMPWTSACYWSLYDCFVIAACNSIFWNPMPVSRMLTARMVSDNAFNPHISYSNFSYFWT